MSDFNQQQQTYMNNMKPNTTLDDITILQGDKSYFAPQSQQPPRVAYEQHTYKNDLVIQDAVQAFEEPPPSLVAMSSSTKSKNTFKLANFHPAQSSEAPKLPVKGNLTAGGLVLSKDKIKFLKSNAAASNNNPPTPSP
jgi:hypothetical protein